jgi:hypothetical protein
MALLLSSHNVANYLKGLALCTDADQDKVQIDSIPAKNFNLLVTLSSGHKYLVKQERYVSDGKTAGEFLNVHFCQSCYILIGKILSWFPSI